MQYTYCYYISISIKIYKANKHLNKCLDAVMNKFLIFFCTVFLCMCRGVGAGCVCVCVCVNILLHIII